MFWKIFSGADRACGIAVIPWRQIKMEDYAPPLRKIKNNVTFAPVKTYRSLMEVRR
ncbi:MAG: hypothetical protein KTR30_26625 [Saprospiraceae bacterium]|nr:hypothetical protein [Saprospiraceae bacterium]